MNLGDIVLTQYIKRPHQIRAVARQLKPAHGKVHAVAGWQHTGGINLQAEHGDIGTQAAQPDGPLAGGGV